VPLREGVAKRSMEHASASVATPARRSNSGIVETKSRPRVPNARRAWTPLPTPLPLSTRLLRSSLRSCTHTLTHSLTHSLSHTHAVPGDSADQALCLPLSRARARSPSLSHTHMLSQVTPLAKLSPLAATGTLYRGLNGMAFSKRFLFLYYIISLSSHRLFCYSIISVS